MKKTNKNPYNSKVKVGGDTKNAYSKKSNEIYDKQAVRELKLYEENDGQLYKSQKMPIYKNLDKKREKGTYDSELATKSFKNYSDNAGKKYTKEFGSRGEVNNFTLADRRALARELTQEYEEQF